MANSSLAEIGLDVYLRLGGKLEDIDWPNTKCYYPGDDNQFSKIVSCKNKNKKGALDVPIFDFTFENGETQWYAISWVRIKLDRNIHPQYFTK